MHLDVAQHRWWSSEAIPSSVLLMSARHDDMSPSGNTCLGNNLNLRPDLWIYILRYFKEIIRLRRVKQLAFFHFSPIGRRRVETTGRYTGLQFSSRCWSCTESCENRFFQLCSRGRTLSIASYIHYMERQQDMLSGVVPLSFWSSGEVQLCT